MRVLVCGGWDFADSQFLGTVLDVVHKSIGITELVHGDARGADTLAGAWANSRGVLEIRVPAQWRVNGAFDKSAGFRRNRVMLDVHNPELVLAFPGGKGTAHMVRIARNASVPVVEVSNDQAG